MEGRANRTGGRGAGAGGTDADDTQDGGMAAGDAGAGDRRDGGNDAGEVKVRARIYGESYVVRAAHGDARRVEEAVERLDVRMREMGRRHPRLDPASLAVLTALNLQDELIVLEESHRRLTSSLARRLRELEGRQ